MWSRACILSAQGRRLSPGAEPPPAHQFGSPSHQAWVLPPACWLPFPAGPLLTFSGHPRARPSPHGNTLLSVALPPQAVPTGGGPPRPPPAPTPTLSTAAPPHVPPPTAPIPRCPCPRATFFRTSLFRKYSEEQGKGKSRKTNNEAF